MRVVGLVSGGKDSCYSLMQCVAAGHQVVALANLSPKDVDELNSYMYQSVGHMGIDLYAEATGLPLFRRTITGTSLATSSIDYTVTEGDEVEDLYYLLKEVKDKCNIEAVSCGAVKSDYQRVRVENVCQRLGLVSLAYLWQRDQSELLQEMIDCGLNAILIKVAAIGLVPTRHLGKSIKEMQPYLESLKEKYKVHVCGEGGEYETFTLDCPLFKKKIVVEETKIVESSGDVGYLNFQSLKLVSKDVPEGELLGTINLKTPHDMLHDLRLKAEEQQAEDQAKEQSVDDDYSDGMFPSNQRSKTRTSSILEDETPLTCYNSGYLWTSVYSSSVHDAMHKLKKTLEEKGMTFEDLISVNMYIKDMADYAAFNAEYIQYFSVNPPTRACVQIPLNEEVGICMDVVGWKNPYAQKVIDSCYSPSRKTMHVQSISHWAPANIGPYSQAIKIDKIIMIAGMIGLVPGTLEIMSEGVEVQSRLALRHVNRVLAAMAPKANIRTVVQGICYVTSLSDVGVAKRMMARVSESQITSYLVVPALPKKALVEWHMWAHLDNDKFDYEERGYTKDNVSVLLRRRLSCDLSVCALITTASSSNPDDITEIAVRDMISYSLQKMGDEEERKRIPINMTLYYKASALPSDLILTSVKMCSYNISKSVVPVVAIEDKQTLISITMIRH